MTFRERYRGGKRQERFAGDVPYHEHSADDILGGVFRGIVLGGDFYSANWKSGGGSVPANLAAADTGATTGFYWDVSEGSGQMMGDLWVGGEITVTDDFAGNDVIVLSGENATYRVWVGHSAAASAPFRVTKAGALTATGATVSGTITATAGAIGGFDIGADYIRDAADSFGLASTVTGGDDVRFWAGDTFANRATAPFRVSESGDVWVGDDLNIVSGGSINILNGAGTTVGYLNFDGANAFFGGELSLGESLVQTGSSPFEANRSFVLRQGWDPGATAGWESWLLMSGATDVALMWMNDPPTTGNAILLRGNAATGVPESLEIALNSANIIDWTKDTLSFYGDGVELLRLVESTTDEVLLGARLGWIADADSYLDGVTTADQWDIYVGGVKMWSYIEGATDYNESFVQLRVPSGSSTVPGLGVGESTSGLYLFAAGRPFLTATGEMGVYRQTSTATDSIVAIVSDSGATARTHHLFRSGTLILNRFEAETTSILFGGTGTSYGTATNPAIAWANDTNTGIYHGSSADQLYLATAGAGQLFLNSTGGVLALNPTGGLGYGTGAGGTVTQITNKGTGVTLNKVCGQITMAAGLVNAGAEQSFTLTNSTIATTDVVVVCHDSVGTLGAYFVSANNIGAGSCQITLTNVSGSNLNEQIVLNFVVVKAVTS